MGEHKKELGKAVIAFLEQLGHILGYVVVLEDYMFPGNRNSPIIDVVWKRQEKDKFPIFIFEVESEPQKSASDNVIKVFSRKTEKYPKPFYFFHVFCEKVYQTDRIQYLKENFDKQNYGSYLLSGDRDQILLIGDILEQHFRLEEVIDLFSLIVLFEEYNPFSVTSTQLLEWLVELGYDLQEDANFLSEVETLIIDRNYSSIRCFYLSYLPRFLAYETKHTQDYQYLGAFVFSDVFHWAIILLENLTTDYPRAFKELVNIENSWDLWSGWKLNIHLSNDHDAVALDDYPLMLTMLSLAFDATEFSKYYSNKLKQVIEEAQSRSIFFSHGLIWLLIASRISSDRESYDFARSALNDRGGIPADLIGQPSKHRVESDERINASHDYTAIPEFDKWPEMSSQNL